MKAQAVMEEEVVEVSAEPQELPTKAYSAALLSAAWPAKLAIPTGQPRRIIGLACEPVRRGRPPSVRH
jgi:hypothetical protein